MAHEINITLPLNYKCRAYQKPFWEAAKKFRRMVLVWHRRAGKEKTCWNYMVMQACKKVGIYYYFFPHFSQGRKILWDGIDKDGFRFLDHIPKELLYGPPNSTEMKIRLRNGSIIQIIGTNNTDGIVGTNPIGCVFSEYSLQDPIAWQLIRPILTENGGWAIFNFCVSGDTIVFTRSGILKISNVVSNSKPGFTDIDLDIYGLGGYNKAVSFYNGGKKRLLKITTKLGYEIRCTPNHPLYSLSGWKEASNWLVGDSIPIQKGMGSWGAGVDVSEWIRPTDRIEARGRKNVRYNPVLDEDTAYLLGLILAEGSWQKGSVTITNTDPEIISWINDRGFKSYDKFHHVFCSAEFVSFIEWVGIKKGAKNKEFPEKILLCPENIVAAFISGYFDGDGCATKRGLVHCDSVSEVLIKQLQVVLLNFGIISSRRGNHVPPTKRVRSASFVWRLELTREGSNLFFRKIGFRLSRKQCRSSLVPKRFKDDSSEKIPLCKEWSTEYFRGMNMGTIKGQRSISYKTAKRLLVIKHDDWLESVVNNNFFYDKVRSIESSYGNVYDFVIPETHSFCSNGIVSHNTPRGANHAKELYDMAVKNPEWFAERLTIEDTGVVTAEDIQAERDAGMSEDFIQQEFYTSFTLGVEGSYYAKYMQDARDEGRIARVGWNTQTKVNTAWDIGYGDSTCIIWYQVIGQEIAIVDFYEAHGEGFAHYAKVIKDKPYVYGDHYAPHDIESHAFSSGLSAKEVGSSLGIKFTTLPTLKIGIDDGIEAVRGIFPRIWIDEQKCAPLIKSLENYRKEFDSRLQVYKNRPLHDKHSHAADAMRYMAIAIKRYVDLAKEGVTDKQASEWYDKFNPRFE